MSSSCPAGIPDRPSPEPVEQRRDPDVGVVAGPRFLVAATRYRVDICLVEQRPTVGDAPQWVCHQPVGARPHRVGRTAEVGGDDDPGRGPERVPGRERLGVGDVERGPQPPALHLASSASVTTIAPRATLTSRAPSGIAARKSRSTNPRVCSVNGTTSTTMSASGRKLREVRDRAYVGACVRPTRVTAHSKPPSRRWTRARCCRRRRRAPAGRQETRLMCMIPLWRRMPAPGRPVAAGRRSSGRPRARTWLHRGRRPRCRGSPRRARTGQVVDPAVRVCTTRSLGMVAMTSTALRLKRYDGT